MPEPTHQGVILENDKMSEMSVLSELMESSMGKSSSGGKTMRKGKRPMKAMPQNIWNMGGNAQIPKNTHVATSGTPWENACDRCHLCSLLLGSHLVLLHHHFFPSRSPVAALSGHFVAMTHGTGTENSSSLGLRQAWPP